jgi:hypothetical protein
MAGCASQPKEDEAARTANKPACSDDASNPLHLTTLRKKEVPRDPELESLLNQSGDPRLLQINREMYQTLRSLDAELRRRQQLAACERGNSDIQPLQAKSTPDSGSGNGVGSAGNSMAGAGGGFGFAGGASAVAGGPNSGGGVGGGTSGGAGVASGGVSSGVGASASSGSSAAVGGNTSSGSSVAANRNTASGAVTSSAGLTPAGAGTTAATRAALVRKSSVSPSTYGGGGNGATAQKVSAGSDNDIVARRLRKAAEQETDPAVKAKLWKEYAQYQQGSGTK